MTDDLLQSLANFRDLGGLPTDDGRSTRHGVLYRADAPRPDDLAPVCADWPPALVVDLRSPDELDGTHPLAGPRTTVAPIPLLGTARPRTLAELQAGAGSLTT